MIIDCDTHYLPPDAYDYMGPEWEAKRPRFAWDDKGLLTGVDFPGAPPPVPGATPLEPPGTGARYRGMYYMEERLNDYQNSDPYGSHRELWPFFARAQALGMPLFLHNIQHGHRITNLLNYQLNGLDVLAPQEGQMSLVSLITSGLLDNFPRLNFVFTEAGVSFLKPLAAHLDAAHGESLVDYESEDAAARFNYRKLTGGKRIVSEADYQATIARRTGRRSGTNRC